MHLINVFGDDASPDFACSERKRTGEDALDEIEIYISHMFARLDRLVVWKCKSRLVHCFSTFLLLA